MGTCKDEMAPKTEKGKSLLGMIRARKKTQPEAQPAAASFGDKLADLEDTLKNLITTKEAELNSEKGRESYNKKALAHLETMRFHVDSVIDLAEEYQHLN